MFWISFILSIAILAIGLLLMSIQIILKGRFPEYRIGHNKELRKRKIYCPKTQQKLIDKESDDDSYCSACV